MKPIATYFATPPSNESQAPVHVHVPEPDANILSTEASDANIVEDIFAGIDDKKIIEHFHSLRDRRGHLPNPPRILTT